MELIFDLISFVSANLVLEPLEFSIGKSVSSYMISSNCSSGREKKIIKELYLTDPNNSQFDSKAYENIESLFNNPTTSSKAARHLYAMVSIIDTRKLKFEFMDNADFRIVYIHDYISKLCDDQP